MNMEFDLSTDYEPQKVVAVPVGEESILDEQLQADINSIPSRMAFKIGEVAQMADVKPYVLRYWESEFGVLKPKKSSNNQRVYQRKDVEFVYIIKKLLYRDKYSINGAKAAIKRYKKQSKKAEEIFANRERFDGIIGRAKSLVEKIDSCLVSLKN